MRSLALLSVLLLVASGCDSDSGGNGTPVTADILKVTVSNAPRADPAGDGWDGGSTSNGPEVYFRLFDVDVDYQSDPGGDRLNPRDDNSVFATNSPQAWYEDVELVDFPLVWNVDPGYTVRDLDDQLYVALFDYDSNADDPMAESEVFTMRDFAPGSVTNRAQTITLDGFDRNGTAIGDFDVRLTVQFFD